MLEVQSRPVLNQLTPAERIPVLKELVITSFNLIRNNQFDNGCIPASLGRFDDTSFYQTVWIKDAARAVQFALDPHFRLAFPELIQDAEQLYLSTTRGILRLQTNPEQIVRFQSKPGLPDEDGYSTISDDQLTPAIKFYGPDGSIIKDWGHNQPDNWGILLLEAGKGIAADVPVLEADGFNPGEVLANITSYAANLKVERFSCRSIWESNVAWSSYSTRHIVLAGLEQIAEAWEYIEADSQQKSYQLPIKRRDITKSIKSLRNLVNEHPGDYTDSRNHHFAGDLASLVVLNDVELPENEQQGIVDRITLAKLENGSGFFRWLGDPWKKDQGGIEAKWTMGKPILARYFFRKAIELASAHPTASRRELDHGLDRMQNIIDIIVENGYMPELFNHDPKTDTFPANNNDLAWNRSYLIQAASAAIIALQTREQLKIAA